MAQRKTSDTSASAALNDARMLKSSARPLWLAFCSGDKVRSKKSVKIRTCLNTPTARLPDLSPVKCGGHCVQRNSELFNRPQEDEIGSESKYLACARKIPIAAVKLLPPVVDPAWVACASMSNAVLSRPLDKNLRAWTFPSAVSAAAMRNDRTPHPAGEVAVVLADRDELRDAGDQTLYVRQNPSHNDCLLCVHPLRFGWAHGSILS